VEVAVSSGKARLVIQRFYRTAQEPHGVDLHVMGFTCATHPGPARPIVCRRGSGELRAANVD
jgi:hypothetical protein